MNNGLADFGQGMITGGVLLLFVNWKFGCAAMVAGAILIVIGVLRANWNEDED